MTGTGNGCHGEAGLAAERLAVTITDGMLEVPGLTLGDLVLLGRIHALQYRGGACWATNPELAERLPLSAKHISERIGALVSAGILSARYVEGRRYLAVYAGWAESRESKASVVSGWAESGGSKASGEPLQAQNGNQPIRPEPARSVTARGTDPAPNGRVANNPSANGTREQATHPATTTNRSGVDRTPPALYPMSLRGTPDIQNHTHTEETLYHARARESPELMEGAASEADMASVPGLVEAVSGPPVPSSGDVTEAQGCQGSVPWTPLPGSVPGPPEVGERESGEGPELFRAVAARVEETAARAVAAKESERSRFAAEDRVLDQVRFALGRPLSEGGFGMTEGSIYSLLRGYALDKIREFMPGCLGEGVSNPAGALIGSLKAGKLIVRSGTPAEAGRKGGSVPGSGGDEYTPRADDRGSIAATKEYLAALKEEQPETPVSEELASLLELKKAMEGWKGDNGRYVRQIEQKIAALQGGIQ